MTSNPHPEHGPLWVERNPAWSHAGPAAFLCWPGSRLPLDAAEADAIEAQITPLPDGVYRARLGHKRGHELAAGYELPAGWTAPGLHGDGPWVSRVPIHRNPAEPPAPATEDVPLHELCGRKLLGCDWEVLGVRFTGYVRKAYNTPAPELSDKCAEFDLNPDGTVTVQRETPDEDGAA